MESKKSSVIYYSLIFLPGFTSLFALINWLQWPLTASIVLGVCVLFQIMYISRIVFETWNKAAEKNITLEIYSDFKSGFKLAGEKRDFQE